MLAVSTSTGSVSSQRYTGGRSLVFARGGEYGQYLVTAINGYRDPLRSSSYILDSKKINMAYC